MGTESNNSISMNLTQRLREGRRLARAKHLEKEARAIGNLRAGNSGIMSVSGDIAGSCHRKSHLRQLGIEVDPPDDSRVIMFQMGTANEDVVYNDLLGTLGKDEIILREEEIPIEWLTSNGTKVTGRPDMVVCSGDKTPQWGIEIKSIASVWTSRDIIGEQTPKLDHMIQAAHYAWQLSIPFRLIYKQYSIQEIPSWRGSGDKPGWGRKLFPREGEPGSEHIDYERGRINPFEVVYELEVDSQGTLRYRREDVEGVKWIKTLISTEDLKRYYEFVSQMGSNKKLGSRPMTINPQGKEKNWSMCDAKYCPLSGICDKFENRGYDTWLSEVRKKLKS